MTDANLLLGYLAADVAARRRRRGSTGRPPSAPSGALADELGLGVDEAAAGIVARGRAPRWRRRCAW